MREQSIIELTITGATLLGAGYVVAVVAAGASLQNRRFDGGHDPCWDVAGALGFTPVVGPIASMAVANNTGCANPGTNTTVMVISIALQLPGLGLLLGGVLGERQVLRFDGPEGAHATIAVGAAGTDIGMTVLGAF